MTGIRLGELKTAVSGLGSIACRHIRLLQERGCREIIGYDPAAAARAYASEDLGITVKAEGGNELFAGCDLAVIASPTSCHAADTHDALRAGCHVFIEKPLAHTLDSLVELEELAAKRECLTMVGCNMRFHPVPLKVKELLGSVDFGYLRSARLECGSYLPDWHPDADYRTGYSARLDLGGGCLLDCIHEIDLAAWLFGELKEFSGELTNYGLLGIETEEAATLRCRTGSDAEVIVDLDYLHRPPMRGGRIDFSEGTIVWDIPGLQVTYQCAKNGKAVRYAVPSGYDYPDAMYRDEWEYFFNCLAEFRSAENDIAFAASLLRRILALKQAVGVVHKEKEEWTK